VSDNKMIKLGSAQSLSVTASALNGDQVRQTLALEQRLRKEALDCRKSVLGTLFPSELTKEVRAAERDIVVTSLRMDQEVLDYLYDAIRPVLRAALDQIVTNGVADARADTSSRLLARREALEVSLTASWRRFCEAAVEEQQWAERMPPAMRKLALQKVTDSLEGFYHMMTAMLREFEGLVHQKVGQH
jgi:hypothetical protein